MELPWIICREYLRDADLSPFTQYLIHPCVVMWVTELCVSEYRWGTDMVPEFAVIDHYSRHIQPSTSQMEPMRIWGDIRFKGPHAFILLHPLHSWMTYVKSPKAFAPRCTLTCRYSRPGLSRHVPPADPSLWRFPSIGLSCESALAWNNKNDWFHDRSWVHAMKFTFPH